ncbi:MAG TPA: peptide chain release factor N(5)-glutamine methyltransferase [Pusillimonas sp.]|uniref:peptide chain release factor N(5)-glutamine methyltransferase n=1 Tax=unclassified Pusillimonas TaxID=2640016 RepID=UPI002633ABBD|nr:MULTISPECIES: peptide chain release factor N(5)-glutamine methyltransferase [unclassified Pusillimonas]HLU19131.1 peptide chain release factor N(5)-glutamine methyltransferase [Pusillimonas sp.]
MNTPGKPGTCVRDLLRNSTLPRLEVQMLLQHVFKVTRSWLIAHDTDTLDEDGVQEFHRLVDRRQAGEPMAYLVGHREFMGHAFQVEPGVLIPRPETELLVETAIAVLATCASDQPRVLDLGTGSGAIAISIALARPDVVVVATDISDAALKVARRNAQALSARVTFIQGSWFDPLSGQAPFDLIVSNPPYIHKNDPHLQQGDLRFEPGTALSDGSNGLEALAHIAANAPGWLKPGGALWMEHGFDQAAAVRGLLSDAGFKQVNSHTDLAGIERISGGNL